MWPGRRAARVDILRAIATSDPQAPAMTGSRGTGRRGGNSGRHLAATFFPVPPAMCNGGRMRSLLYSINVTLDGCVDHAGSGVIPDQELHERSAETIAAADAPIFGRITYQMMEEAWRPVAAGEPADWVEDWMRPFARTIDGAKKYVVTQTLDRVDWNAEIIRPADLEASVRKLKAQAGGRLHTGGVRLPLTLVQLGLVDEFEFVVHPAVAGRGPTLMGRTARLRAVPAPLPPPAPTCTQLGPPPVVTERAS